MEKLSITAKYKSTARMSELGLVFIHSGVKVIGETNSQFFLRQKTVLMCNNSM